MARKKLTPEQRKALIDLGIKVLIAALGIITGTQINI